MKFRLSCMYDNFNRDARDVVEVSSYEDLFRRMESFFESCGGISEIGFFSVGIETTMEMEYQWSSASSESWTDVKNEMMEYFKGVFDNETQN